GAVTGAFDANSTELADAGTTGTIKSYTIADIVPGFGGLGAPVATATAGTPRTVVVGGNSITVTVTGPGSVDIYDNAATADRVDLLVIHDSTSGTNVTVTSTDPATLGLGRVVTADDAQIGTVTLGAAVLGDDGVGTDLWLDGGVGTLTLFGMPDRADWVGKIGSDVSSLTLGT